MGNKQSSLTLDFTIFSDAGAANQILARSEKIDRYREQCANHKANSIARRGQPYMPYNCSQDYLILLKETLEASKKHLPNKLLNELTNVAIVVVYPSTDGGMPHTRPENVICFPYGIDYPSLETIEHELWHLHQRRHPEFWEKLLATQWNFKPYNASLPPLLEKQRRLNPDTVLTPYWIWNNEWIPVPIFQNVTQPTLADCKIWFYNAKTELVDHDVPKDIANYFGRKMPMAAFEHPYEMAAYMLSLGSAGAGSQQTPAWNAIKEVLNN
jgi:hypothetical protein